MPIFVVQFLKSFVALFIITDILGNLPFFVGLTEGFSREEKRRVFATSILTGLILLATFVFAGSLIFELFSLTIEDMKISGGILLLFIAVEIMLRGRVHVAHKEDMGVVPLGSPLLVGPGAITTTLVLIHIYSFWAVLLAIAACFFVIWLVLHYSDFIYNLLGHNGALIITKIAAIIIAAIAVFFIRQGIQNIFFKGGLPL